MGSSQRRSSHMSDPELWLPCELPALLSEPELWLPSDPSDDAELPGGTEETEEEEEEEPSSEQK